MKKYFTISFFCLLFAISTNAQETENQQESGIVQQALDIIIGDWIPLGNRETNRFDYGRIQTTPSINHLEGFRLRAGVASNTRLHPNFFVRGYVAYGFRDERFKYRGEAAWAFNRPVYHENEFPRNLLRVIHENDIFSFGEMNARATHDRLLLTYVNSHNAMTYRTFTEIHYEKETLSGFAFMAWARRSEITSAPFTTNLVVGEPPLFLFPGHLITSDVGISLRYAFDENYEQYRRRRRTASPRSPVLFLTHTVGIDGFLGSQVGYHRTQFSAQKRFPLGSIGRLDVVSEAIRVWNAVPFPLLAYNNQNIVHNIESPRFFLNHATEFMADELYTARFTFVGDNLLFSRIPFVGDRLRIRELLAVRASYGRLSERNQQSMFAFPPYWRKYGNRPFVEGSIGLTNILGLLRIEYVHRFTYRETEHLHPLGKLGMIRVDVTL